ncbi:hypothetical protein B5C34_08765 [Pacificimonas flava]|uniref:Uncharacterized protein n=2 Tax=Pacificimonas TaxID=1960290 RepID=A0A219B5X4_9SPHN|nr:MULTISPECIES: hypothetical protein [Pacificimonas]MBZ6379243.1 hypothetical protein [Pacificimonas aurantium]OWV33543.1 hypothetical protein B5C34_08765 [Pacificimonas flava]
MTASVQFSLNMTVTDPAALWNQAARAILCAEDCHIADIEELIGAEDDPDIEACLEQLGASIRFAGCEPNDQSFSIFDEFADRVPRLAVSGGL